MEMDFPMDIDSWCSHDLLSKYSSLGIDLYWFEFDYVNIEMLYMINETGYLFDTSRLHWWSMSCEEREMFDRLKLNDEPGICDV